MKVLSVNIAKAQPIKADDLGSNLTGIFKLPVSNAVKVTKLGLEGDAICSKEHHGGPDQAVYVYFIFDYEWWSKEIGRELEPGIFGENLTVSNFESGKSRVGDRLYFKDVILEVTSPRIPCGNFATRMGDTKFPKLFRHAERPGVYCRVIKEGTVCAGEEIRYEPFVGETVTVLEMFRDFFKPELTESTIKRFLNAPIAIRSREEKESQLRKLLKG